MKQHKWDQCRAVIVTGDGQRFTTRWRPNKPFEQLGPDEFPSIMRLIKVADRYAVRKGLMSYSIGAEYATRHGKEDDHNPA